MPTFTTRALHGDRGRDDQILAVIDEVRAAVAEKPLRAPAPYWWISNRESMELVLYARQSLMEHIGNTMYGHTDERPYSLHPMSDSAPALIGKFVDLAARIDFALLLRDDEPVGLVPVERIAELLAVISG